MTRTIELKEIEELISGWHGLYLVGDAGSVWIDWPASAEDRKFLKAYVAWEIARRDSISLTPTQPLRR